MRYLLFGSLFFCLFTACSSSKAFITNDIGFIPFWTQDLRDSMQKNDFRMVISTPKANITGICIVKQVDGIWKGSIINEFGLKVFDFVSTPKKCELMNVVSFLNKSYIKKVIASDIQFIMEIDNPNYFKSVQSNRQFVEENLVIIYKNEKQLQRHSDGKVEYKNNKHKLNYTLTKINEIKR